MITSLFFAVLNLFIAMNSDNPNPWYNWMASGFCFGLFLASVVMEMSE
jgi:hypothetical protein